MNNLPPNLIFYICCFLPIQSIFRFGSSCKKMRDRILNNENLWEAIAKRDFPNDEFINHKNFKSWKEFVKNGCFKWDKQSPISKFLEVNKKKSQKKKFFYPKKKKIYIKKKNLSI